MTDQQVDLNRDRMIYAANYCYYKLHGYIELSSVWTDDQTYPKKDYEEERASINFYDEWVQTM